MKNQRKKIRQPKLSPVQKEFIYAQPLSVQFRIIHIDADSGCAVYQHVLVDTAERDYKQVVTVAKAYARETNCRINPVIMPQAKRARQILFPGIEDNANPDLTTDKYGYIDVKSPHNKNNVVRNANSASAQGAIAVITDLTINEVLRHKMILQLTHKIFSEQNKNLLGEPNYIKDEVHWFVKGELLKYNRSEK